MGNIVGTRFGYHLLEVIYKTVETRIAYEEIKHCFGHYPQRMKEFSKNKTTRWETERKSKSGESFTGEF